MRNAYESSLHTPSSSSYSRRSARVCTLVLVLACLHSRVVHSQAWPVAHDTDLRRVSVTNADGDVYVESTGDGSEIVFKTRKVRVDGDVYCGESTIGVSQQLIDFQPPKCTRPGGDKLQYGGENWICVCIGAYNGVSCESTWTPEARIVNSSVYTGSYHIEVNERSHQISAYGDEFIVGNGGQLRNSMIFKRSSSSTTLSTTWEPVWNFSSSYLWPSTNSLDFTNFGAAVSLWGDLVLVSATLQQFCISLYTSSYNSCNSYRNGAGFALIFERDAAVSSEWVLIANLTAPDANMTSSYSSNIRFGHDVAISDSIALVSSAPVWMRDENFDSYYELPGAVYIFERQSGSSSSPWTFTTKIHSNIGGNTYDMFGASVAISGKYALIGAAGDRDKGDNAGAAYIFTRSDDSGEWEQRAKLVAYDGSQNDQFGFSVSISGDIAIVGAPYDDENGQESGSAYIYERSSATNEWVLSTKLTTTNGAQNDNFGRSVSINDNRALVGAFQKASGFGGSGIAYLFEKQSDTNTWTEVARLTDFEGIFSEFAANVALSTSYAVATNMGGWNYYEPSKVFVVANTSVAS